MPPYIKFAADFSGGQWRSETPFYRTIAADRKVWRDAHGGAELTCAEGLLDCGKVLYYRDGGRDMTVAAVLRAVIAEQMRRQDLHRVVIGVSGGIDSAVSAALYASFLPPENILLVSMPGPFTSRTTKSLAAQLAENIGARFEEIPIAESVALTERQFANFREKSAVWIENVQARDRGSRILAAAAAAFGGVIACNANKAEITIGYGTLYGDIIGWLAALGDLWKGEVYELGRELNKEAGREIIPEGCFTVKPSAELSAAQAVEEGKGDPLDYPYHDALFRSWVERENWDEIPAVKPEDARWWRLFTGLAKAKRLVAPPIISLSHRPFGSDYF